MSEWQPIETAPADTLVLIGWWVQFSDCAGWWETDIGEVHEFEHAQIWAPIPMLPPRPQNIQQYQPK